MRTRRDLTLRRCLVAAAAALVVLTSAAPGDAAFNASTANRGMKVSTTALGAPSNLSVAMSGASTTATATAGAKANGYQVAAAAPTSTASVCPTSYSGFKSPTNGSVVNNFGAAANGFWVCEQARSTYTPSSWTSQPDSANPTQQVRLGLYPTGVTLSRPTCTLQLCNPVITITFNQPIADPTGSSWTADSVCFAPGNGSASPDLVIVADTNTRGCKPSDGSDVGTISGYTVTKSGLVTPVTYTRSSDSRSLVVTLPATSTTYLTGTTGSFRAVSGNKVTTAADSSVPICSTTSAPDCAAPVSGTL